MIRRLDEESSSLVFPPNNTRPSTRWGKGGPRVVRGDSAKDGILDSSISLVLDWGVGIARNDRSNVFPVCSFSPVKRSNTGRPRAKKID